MSWPVAPWTSPWADSTHPASNTGGCSPRGEGPGLADRRYPAAPAATTSRDWKPGWEKGFLSHPVTCRVYLASSSFTHSMQTDQKDLKRDLQPIPTFTSSHPHYRDALSARSDPLCLCIRTWLKNTWLTDTFKYGGNQMSKYPNAFAIWEKATFCFPAVAALTTLMDLTAQTEIAFQILPRKRDFGILNYSIFQVIHKD